MSITRLDQGELPSIQESIQSTVQRFTSRDAVPKAKFNINSNKNPQGFVASRIYQRQRLLPFAEISKSSQRNGDNGDNNDNDEEIDDDDEEECDFSISSRRSLQIDSERIVLQHQLRGVAVSYIPYFCSCSPLIVISFISYPLSLFIPLFLFFFFLLH
jgi:hypothetical protein